MGTESNWGIQTLDLKGRPMGITFDSMDQIFISEFDTRKISVYDTSFKHLADFETELLQAPHHSCFDREGILYIMDFMGNKVLKFNLETLSAEVFIEFARVKSPWQITGPCAGQFDADNNLLLVNYGSHCIVKFSKTGEFLGWLGLRNENDTPNGWKTDGAPIFSKAPGGFENPNGLTIDANGFIYIADTVNNRIQRFNSKGEWAGWLGAVRDRGFDPTAEFRTDHIPVGTEMPAGFSLPMSVATDNEFLYVVESGAHRIQKFTMSGKYSGWMGSLIGHRFTQGWDNYNHNIPSNIPGGFCRPYDITIHKKSIYVADTYNLRIQKIPVMT